MLHFELSLVLGLSVKCFFLGYLLHTSQQPLGVLKLDDLESILVRVYIFVNKIL
jgi:hypothetical protein